MEAHPIADLFPMLPDDELKDLAADIKVRGLLQPIVRHEGMILDGRNRYQACEIAGIKPQFVDYDGDDPDGYALTVNIARRQMSKGQRAIVIARALKKDTDSVSGKDAARIHGISPQYIANANVIITHAADEADGVLTNTQTFDKAYDIAAANKKAKQVKDEKLAALRNEAPDLADEVTEERLTFEDAIKELEERREDRARAAAVAEIDKLVDDSSGGNTPNFTQRVEANQITWTEAHELAKAWKREYDEAIQRNVNRIMRVNEGWATISELFTNPDRTFYKDLVNALSNADRERLNEIRQEIITLATKLEGTGQ